MAEILVTKPGALNQRDRSLLRKAGVVCIEADSPADVKLVQAHGELSGGDLLYAAMQALSRDGSAWDLRDVFIKAVLAGLEAQRADKP